MAPYQELQESIIEQDVDKVREITRTLLDKGNNPTEIMFEGLVPAMSVVGQKMKTGELFIPEVIASAQAIRGGMELIKPLLTADELSDIYIGKVVMGTVHGDVHDIGKSIVNMVLESAGFIIVDLGVDVPTDKFIEVVEQEQPDILGLSALMTTTMPAIKEVIEALKSKGLRDRVRVMVGGAPITQSFADSIEADGYAPDAGSTVDKAKQLVG